MLPTLLITVREVIEASLIVATILGILTKLKQQDSIRFVWIATISAIAASFLLVFCGSFVGLSIQHIYSGKSEPMVEGVLLTISAFFVTWAVFVLHKHFARKKMHLLQKVKETLIKKERSGIFLLTFFAVFREGIEIVLFLSTLYLTTTPLAIGAGFVSGVILGLFTSLLFFSATIRMPIYYAFRATSVLLILFAAGLLARGLGEFIEATSLPSLMTFTFPLLPSPSTVIGGMIETMFGITRSMHAIQVISYSLYLYTMHWWVFIRKEKVPQK